MKVAQTIENQKLRAEEKLASDVHQYFMYAVPKIQTFKVIGKSF